jgi:hypothetical protein
LPIDVVNLVVGLNLVEIGGAVIVGSYALGTAEMVAGASTEPESGPLGTFEIGPGGETIGVGLTVGSTIAGTGALFVAKGLKDKKPRTKKLSSKRATTTPYGR